MRKALAALSVLAAALVIAPVPTAASVESDSSRSGTTQEARGLTDKQRVIKITNNRRRAHGCRNLRSNAALTRAAQKHTNKMADQDQLSHQLPGEAALGARITREGYRYRDIAENIAWNAPTPRAVVNVWMQSNDGHRENILNCRFKHIGIGIAISDDGEPYWTQDFGRPR